MEKTISTRLDIDKEKVGKAIGRIVSGLYIVSLKAGDDEAGFLASWVQQAAFEPPTISIAFNKERKHHFDLLTKSGKLVLNIMGKENSKTVSKFFKAPPEGKSIFTELETFIGITGIPILKDSVAYLECKYKSEIDVGDHILAMLEVVSGNLHNPEIEPSVHLRPNGFKY